MRRGITSFKKQQNPVNPTLPPKHTTSTGPAIMSSAADTACLFPQHACSTHFTLLTGNSATKAVIVLTHETRSITPSGNASKSDSLPCTACTTMTCRFCRPRAQIECFNSLKRRTHWRDCLTFNLIKSSPNPSRIPGGLVLWSIISLPRFSKSR